ncbi:hypothetical protein [Serinicoccus sp. CNJ-927]|uniref:hypothetical protein n=1 Tax=Serinicoccus sp. CNJ-927 TaxID=1904970 RepID=UPI0011799976|nr:hypothetical protein [Serinicoccus sp. CNJ-927]
MSDVAPLIDTWATDYGTLEEEVPDPEAMERLRSKDTPRDWPMPAVRFVNQSGTEAIIVQNGRFDIEWTFASDTEGASLYPGYDALESELQKRFDEYRDRVRIRGLDITPYGAECRYENPLPECSAAEAAVGVLTQWSGEPAVYLPENGYVGVRLHGCADPANNDCSSYIAVDGDPEAVPILSIVVEKMDADGTRPLGGLRQAHDELIDLFFQYTSSEQHEKWGMER